jgi:hypothetical protein
MILLDAFRHQWYQRTRSPTWGRSVIGALFLLLAAGYFGILFVALGWLYPEIVAEVPPSREPLRLLNEFLLYGAVGLVGAYVAFLVGWMGSVFPETLTESEVQRAPARMLNAPLMSAFAGLLAVRFVLQRFDGSGWRPFLS